MLNSTGSESKRLSTGATLVTLTDTTTHCGFHEICYHIQQAVYVSAIVVGIALVFTGIFLTRQQPGELLELVYIGALLVVVNVGLLSILCHSRLKQRNRGTQVPPIRPSPPTLVFNHTVTAKLPVKPLPMVSAPRRYPLDHRSPPPGHRPMPRTVIMPFTSSSRSEAPVPLYDGIVLFQRPAASLH